MPLSDVTARSAKPREKPCKLSDSKRLSLQVEPDGSKLWRLKYQFSGKERRLAFGAYPEVTLARARERQPEARRVLDEGIDPGELKKQARRTATIAHANSFEAVAREWFFKHVNAWAPAHSSKVLLRLENDLIP